MIRLWTLIGAIAIALNISAQENIAAVAKEKKNVLTVAIAYTYIPAGTEQDNLEEGHFVPGIGIDYFRKITNRFDLGVMADIELGTYIIPRKDNLIRERAIVLTLIGAYGITNNWAVFLGPGYEFEKHEGFPIFRMGTEYLFNLNERWFIPVGFFYDVKEGYDAWSLSVGAGIVF